MASRKKINQAINEYASRAKQLYPRAEVKVLPDSLDGREPWLEVWLPSRQVEGARQKLAGLANDIDDEFGVFVLAFPRPLNGKAAA